MSTLISLNKFVAQCNIGSRRKAAQFIKDGLITVNGIVIKEPGHKIAPEATVCYKGHPITLATYQYLLLNKPKDYITTLADERGRKTVAQLIQHAATVRLYPVGRLDRNTTGLLLFTNDGALTQKLMHPKFGVKKVYQVKLDTPLSRKDFERIQHGVTLDDGPLLVDAISYVPHQKNEVVVELHSGRYRIVRRLFAFCGYAVTKLDRINYAGLTKKGLRIGQWRFLTPEEIEKLKNL